MKIIYSLVKKFKLQLLLSLFIPFFFLIYFVLFYFIFLFFIFYFSYKYFIYYSNFMLASQKDLYRNL